MFMSCSESTLWRSSAPAQFLNVNNPSTTEGHLRTKYNVKLLFLNPLIYQCTMTHVLLRIYFRLVLTGGTYLSALGSQQGILISASAVPHCGSPVWKNGPCSEHQCIGLLEVHCSNYINVKSAATFAVGKFTTAWVWHKAQQITSQSCLRSRLDEWLHLYVHLSTGIQYGYACMSLWIKCFSRHMSVWVYE